MSELISQGLEEGTDGHQSHSTSALLLQLHPQGITATNTSRSHNASRKINFSGPGACSCRSESRRWFRQILRHFPVRLEEESKTSERLCSDTRDQMDVNCEVLQSKPEETWADRLHDGFSMLEYKFMFIVYLTRSSARLCSPDDVWTPSCLDTHNRGSPPLELAGVTLQQLGLAAHNVQSSAALDESPHRRPTAECFYFSLPILIHCSAGNIFHGCWEGAAFK